MPHVLVYAISIDGVVSLLLNLCCPNVGLTTDLGPIVEKERKENCHRQSSNNVDNKKPSALPCKRGILFP
jgi:hypothetical protein